MAEYDAKLHVRTSTGYDDINLKSKAEIIDFNNSGTNLTSTNAENAIKEINTKALTSGDVVNNLATAVATTVDGVPSGTKIVKELNNKITTINDSLDTKVDVTPVNLTFTWLTTEPREVKSLRIGNQVNIRGFVFCRTGATYPLKVAFISDHKPVLQSVRNAGFVSSGNSLYLEQLVFAEIMTNGDVVIGAAPKQDAFCFFDFNYISG